MLLKPSVANLYWQKVYLLGERQLNIYRKLKKKDPNIFTTETNRNSKKKKHE